MYVVYLHILCIFTNKLYEVSLLLFIYHNFNLHTNVEKKTNLLIWIYGFEGVATTLLSWNYEIKNVAKKSYYVPMVRRKHIICANI